MFHFTDTMTHSILCTNQVRHHVIIVNDIPKICDNSSTQDIRIKENNIVMSVEMNGPIPYIPISRPKTNDIEYLLRIKMTSDEVEWGPQYIFNGGMKNSYLYLEDDFGLSHHIQGLSILQELADEHESRISSLSHKIGRAHV